MLISMMIIMAIIIVIKIMIIMIHDKDNNNVDSVSQSDYSNHSDGNGF
jgi:hypothetical protein